MGGNKDRIKKPKAADSKRLKTPDVPARPDFDDYPPAFSFQYMVTRRYAVGDCVQEDQAAFARTMYKRRSMTWRKLRAEPKHGLGSEVIDKLNVERPRGVTDDVPILAFRFNGKKAMVGFREDQVFYVVWLDHDFTVYDHGP